MRDIFRDKHGLNTEGLIDMAVAVGVILVVAIVIQWTLIVLIRRISRHAIQRGPGHSLFGESIAVVQEETRDRERREARITTLSSVARSAVAIFVWTWAGLAVLSELGVQVGPLVASAGVAGVALGFGAQSLVKDFLSGIFMLIEDQYGVGDSIDVGDAVGTVEAVSLRLTTIRDVDGTLWFVRNGLIQRVGNSTKGHAVARIDVPVGLSNDVEEAKKAIGDAARAAAASDALKDSVLSEPEVDGVHALAVDHMLIRVRAKVVAGTQWATRRELLGRIITDLRDRGISTPYPNGIGISAEPSVTEGTAGPAGPTTKEN
ncbi:mechanosensitive ion channel family protein [Corynebacterium sp. P7202]|uniref:Mechanosensitive ion channel n=1 Tax=Corynebacterium pygosceleis TaxID=2800406 RepID=A0A9Q4CBT6_9CORY|nr:mechanosensitive ion channel domain-containing protein [Corynebacterium pygosceleis]MCK7636403.1 mechanosensitive ion channel family protein [Corynebacterium pygosceleis]MCX7469283.1 mechanosensitive ion channel [Corynebacterium pygosceleis]